MRARPRVLISGGAGFIGSHLCERFLNEGWRVLCLDNFSTGDSTNTAMFEKSPYFTSVYHDVTEPFFADVDLIMNFACPASPIHYQRIPIQTIKTNVLGTINMLELANRLRVRIVQASTSEVYGDPLEHPQSESYWGNVNPIGIRSCYDEGKRVAETLFFDYHRAHGLDIRVLRIFNTYGPRMAIDDGRVISNFICQALKNDDITIYGDGTQTRSFCYVDDLVEGIFRFTLQNKETGPINLGNDKEFSILALAKEVIRQTQSKSKIILQPLPSDDPQLRCPDLTKAKTILNWEPKVHLREGIARVIPYFREALLECDNFKSPSKAFHLDAQILKSQTRPSL